MQKDINEMKNAIGDEQVNEDQVQDNSLKDGKKAKPPKMSFREELRGIKEAFFPVQTPHCNDYPKTVLLVIFVVYYTAYCVVWLLPNPGFTKMIVDFPLLIAFFFLFRKVIIHDFKDLKKNYKSQLAFACMGFVVYIFCELSGALIGGLFTQEVSPNSYATIEAFANYPIMAAIFGFICIVVGAPVMEELMFRRVLRIAFRNRVLFYVASSILFGIVHIVAGFSFPIAFAFMISYVFGGLGFAFLYERTNNIFISIMAHAFTNLIAFAQVLGEVFWV